MLTVNKEGARHYKMCYSVSEHKVTYLTLSVYSTSSEGKTDNLQKRRSSRWHDTCPRKLREKFEEGSRQLLRQWSTKATFLSVPHPARRATPGRPDAKGFLCRVLKLTVSGPPQIFETNHGEEIRYLYTQEETVNEAMKDENKVKDNTLHLHNHARKVSSS
jgi:hypothetical protein